MQEPQGYYAASAGPARPRGQVEGAINADICIIGGGYTGLSAALHAAEAGARVELIEAQTVGFGASGRNGGQIHSGLRKDQAELETWLGHGHARDLWMLTEESKALVRSLVASHRINCELKPGLVIAAHSESAARALAKDTEHLARSYNYTQARMMDAGDTLALLGTGIYPAARFDAGGGHLHPLRFARGLALAAEAGRFDELRRELFAAQPPEQSGGFTISDLTALGRRVGLSNAAYTTGLQEGRYEPWAIEADRVFQEQDPQGTPAALLDAELVDSRVLFDPAALAAVLRR